MSKKDKYNIYEKDGPVGDFSDHGGPKEKYVWYAIYGFAILSTIVLCTIGAINPKQPEFEKPKSTKFICDCKTINDTEQSKTYECRCRSNSKNPAMQVIMKEKTNGR